jgi:3-polyprenyl-4-hydroxybenzoate decarboxylase
MHSVWGAGQMAWTKSVFVVDHDVDVHDVRAVMTAAARHCRPSRDLELVHGPVDILDHAAPHLGTGCKIGFDCTRKGPAEGAHGVPVDVDATGTEPPRRVATAQDAGPHLARVRALPGVVDSAVHAIAPGWLLVAADRAEGEPDRAGIGARVRDAVLALDPATDGVADLPFVVVVGRDAPLGDDVLPFFHWLAHMDAGRDLARVGDRVGFDATAKSAGDARPGWPVRDWPPVVRYPEDVLERARRG